MAAKFLILSLLIITLGSSEAVKMKRDSKCCTKYSREKVSPQNIVKFTKPDHSCSLPAVIIYTRKQGVVCGDPNTRWIKKLLKNLKVRKRKENSNLKGDVKPVHFSSLSLPFQVK
ncbi:chemokine (C-C motif) ligand 44 [Latimeria chalumnae]|uniref:chemokine (C-C motif) ligand 44 n=1 Tax=Latimeria chalumnae TaxID=7897 RepID=UPI0003C1A550|nr:PREDICTED: C-C motif chemokine 18-like [Latimeria chalumnae]|eukprot:XP_005989928.1 PREDICTED: C-C motif chemokine 18-like [Latimeria chalumnae]